MCGYRGGALPAILRTVEDQHYLYAQEKLGQALGELIKAGDIKDRLYKSYKWFLPLSPRQLPEDLREEFNQLKQALSWLPPEYEGQGSAVATINRMTEEEAEGLAAKIFEVYLRMQDS